MIEGKTTVLALVECIVSIAIYIAIGLFTQNFMHYAVAITFAPLLLFRTERSTELTLRIWSKLSNMTMLLAMPIGAAFLLVIVIYIVIGLFTQCLAHYAYAIAFALLLLLFRTDTLSELALRMWSKVPEGIIYGTSALVLIVGLLLLSIPFCILYPISAVCIRIIVGTWMTLRYPFEALREMPNNWVRQSLYVDLYRPPELIPGESLQTEICVLKFAEVVERMTDRQPYSPYGPSELLRIFNIYFGLMLMMLGYIPSVLLRVSFKATSVVYVPLVWMVQLTINSSLSLRLRLERIQKGELEKSRRALSLVILSVFLIKLSAVVGLFDIDETLTRFPSRVLADVFVYSKGWPVWQVALVFDAAMTYVLLFFSDAALARFGTPHEWPERRAIALISTLTFLRAIVAGVGVGHLFIDATVLVSRGVLKL